MVDRCRVKAYTVATPNPNPNPIFLKVNQFGLVYLNV